MGPHVSAVQYELDGILHGLMANPDRKFVYCEMVLSDKCIAILELAWLWPLFCKVTLIIVWPTPQSYFKRWWDIQESGTQDRVRALIQNGQLQFAGGGWVSNDEAICSYDDIIDQLTLGHRCCARAAGSSTSDHHAREGPLTVLTQCAGNVRWLADTFGYIPRQGWQIDTFGHSGVNAALYALSGMDSMFFSRLDTEVGAASLRRTTFRSIISCRTLPSSAIFDVQCRMCSSEKPKHQLEFLWRGTKSYSNWADIWSYAFGTGESQRPALDCPGLPSTDASRVTRVGRGCRMYTCTAGCRVQERITCQKVSALANWTILACTRNIS